MIKRGGQIDVHSSIIENKLENIIEKYLSNNLSMSYKKRAKVLINTIR